MVCTLPHVAQVPKVLKNVMKIYGFECPRDEHLKKTKGKQRILKAMLLSHLLGLASRARGDGSQAFVEALGQNH